MEDYDDYYYDRFERGPVNIPYQIRKIKKANETDETTTAILDIIEEQEDRIKRLAGILYEAEPESDALDILIDLEEEEEQAEELWREEQSEG